MREGLHYNPYFPGGAIAMPKMLADEGTEYDDGTIATESQQAKVSLARMACRECLKCAVWMLHCMPACMLSWSTRCLVLLDMCQMGANERCCVVVTFEVYRRTRAC